MTNSQSADATARSPEPSSIETIRRYLGGRWGLLAVAAAAIVAGLAFNWSWLVAIGVAPLIIGVLPCAAMCALGLCMMGMGRKGAAPGPSNDAAQGAGSTPLSRPDNGGLPDTSGFVDAYDPQGTFRNVLDPSLSGEELAERLRKEIGNRTG